MFDELTNNECGFSQSLYSAIEACFCRRVVVRYKLELSGTEICGEVKNWVGLVGSARSSDLRR